MTTTRLLHPTPKQGQAEELLSASVTSLQDTNSCGEWEEGKYPLLAPEPLGTKQSIHRVNKISLNQRAHHRYYPNLMWKKVAYIKMGVR